MEYTRRQFSHGALTAGLVWTLGRPLTLHGGDGREALPAGAFEKKTFHFDLAHLPAAAVHVLRVSGRQYSLLRHTDATRRSARRKQSGLESVPDARLTHFAADVQVSKRGVQRMHVTTMTPGRGPGLALVAMYIPTAA